MQKIILLSLLIFAFSKLNEVEFNKDLYFDINNNIFEFTSQTSGSLFVSVKFKADGLLNMKLTCGIKSTNIGVGKNGAGTIVDLDVGMNVKIELVYSKSSNKNGTIWINPSTNEIKVDLNKIYKWKFDHNEWIYNRDMNLTYFIDNAEKDVKFIFEYKNEIEGQKVNNPFEICHGSECKKDITTYDFVKGESYKIYVRSTKALFPSFSFHDIDKKDDEDEGEDTDSDIDPDTDSDSDDHSDSDDPSDKGNYSYYVSLNLWIISLILLFL